MHFTKMLSVCCALLFGVFITTDAIAQGNCTNTSSFGGADIATEGPNGQLITITTCSFQTEYATITGVPAGEDIKFTATSGYITVREGSPTGAVVAQGSLTATVAAASGADLYPHWTLDATCATATLCVVTTVECATCPTLCAEGNPGDSCDDGDPVTINDEIQADCSCAGDAPVANDTPCTATALACGDTVAQTLVGASAFGSDACAGDGTVDVYFSFTADGAAEYIVSVVDPSFVFDGVVELLSGPDCSSLASQGCADFPESYSVSVAGDYVFRVRPYFASETDGFSVALECAVPDCPGLGNIGDICDDGNPATFDDVVQADCTCAGTLPAANDNCTDIDASFLLGCGDVLSGNTTASTATEGLSSTCNGFTSTTAEDNWYAFAADGSSSYTVSLLPDVGSLMDGVLFVYSGSCGSLTEVACADTAFASGSGEELVLDGLAAGIYYVRVFNWLTGGAAYTVGLTCEDNCSDPFPAVDEASLSTAFTASAVATSWDPVPGQIGCQIQLRLAGGAILGAQIVPGTGTSGFNIPGSVLSPGTDYEWRVRCGCSQTPIIAGPFSSWVPFTTPGGAAIASMPNPTTGQSNVTFSIAEEGYTTLEVFDMSGRLVDAVFAGNAQPNNEYRFEFDGSSLPNGVYIYRLTTASEVVNDKFMIAR